MKNPSTDLLKALAVTAEVCGGELSEAAAMVMAADLAEYPESEVLAALVRVRREHKGKLMLAAIIERIDDGRPGAEVAWAMIPRDERETAVMTAEMGEALRVACPLMDDEVAARMAFKEAYSAAMTKARAAGEKVRWSVSLGWDAAGRPAPIAEAVRLGRLRLSCAEACLSGETLTEMRALAGMAQQALPAPTLAHIAQKMPSEIRKAIPAQTAPEPLKPLKWGAAYIAPVPPGYGGD